MHTDCLLRDAHPAFSLDFVSIFAQKGIGVLLGIFSNTLAFTLMNFSRVATASTTAEIVFGTLENPFHRAEGDLKIVGQLLLRDRLPLIAFMNALSVF